MSRVEPNIAFLAAQTIFSSLSEQEIETLKKQLEVISIEAKETIFTFGEHAHTMFLVVSGTISVLKQDDYGNKREIAKIIDGDSLGEIDMIMGTTYSVTAIADTDASLIPFPPKKNAFHQFLDANPGPGSKILFAFISDIAKRTREANALLKNNSPYIQELRHQIYEDKLTNLYNKTYLEENLPQCIQAKDSALSLMMIKPDNFKQINDNAGHEAGDKLLVHLAQLLPSVIPQNSTLIRYIGNEFSLLLPGYSREETIKIAEIIRLFYNTLDVSNFLAEEGFHLTVSIGIAHYPEHGKKSEILIEEAHKIPLIGRQRGGNLILFPEDVAERHS